MSRAISSELISDKDVNGYAWPHNHKPPAQKLQCIPLLSYRKCLQNLYWSWSHSSLQLSDPATEQPIHDAATVHSLVSTPKISARQHQSKDEINQQRKGAKKDRGKATPQRHFPCSLARRHGPIGRAIEPKKFSNLIPVANRDAKGVSAATNAAGRREQFHFVSKRYLLLLLIKS